MSDLFDFIHNEENEKQLLQTLTDVFTVDFYKLYDFNPEESNALLSSPEQWMQVLKEVYLAPSSYAGRLWSVEIVNLIENKPIREIDVNQIGKLVQVESLVTRATIPEATITIAAYECPVCEETIMVKQENMSLTPPEKCVFAGCSNRRGFKLKPEKSVYTDTQWLTLQELPEELPPGTGEIPEPLSAVLKGDLIRSAFPADRIKVVGIVTVKQIKSGSPNFVKILDVNNVTILNRNNIDVRLTEERRNEIIELSKNPALEDMLINSYCPSVYGWRHIKKAILRNEFGGVDKIKEGSFVRGWINGLLPGDPGVSKSQMIIFGKELSVRGVWDVGPGVTDVGLTAALVKEDERFVISIGSFPKANKGNLFLDEFEKMRKEDRRSIHVPMESGIVKVTKGGLSVEINAQCSLTAAMNPVDGRYVREKTLLSNLRKKEEDFPDSLISRFDWIFVMLDEVDEERDTSIAERILELSKIKSSERIPFDLMKDYIAYSKHINPTIPFEIKEKMRDYYVSKRQEMKTDLSKIVSPRMLNSLERLIESRARMHLRKEANIEDYEDSVSLYNIYINETWCDPYTGKVDTGPMMGIPARSEVQQMEYIPKVIELMYRNGKGTMGPDGQLFVIEADLMKEVVAVSGGKIDADLARKLIRKASEPNNDLLWCPSPGRYKLSGDRNRMLGDES